MKTSTLLKFLTLFVFVLLVGIFVSYRSGAFSNTNMETAYQPFDTIPKSAKDSIVSDTTKRVMMPGSKSIMIRENHPSRRTSKDDSTSLKDKKRKKVMMESSKLGRILPPGNTIKPNPDTAVKQKKQ